LTVVDPDGESVADATVVVSGGTATLDGVVTDKTGDDGSVDVDVDPSLGPNQDEGTIEIDIKPPPAAGTPTAGPTPTCSSWPTDRAADPIARPSAPAERRCSLSLRQRP